MPSFTGGNLGLTWGFIAHEDGWGTSYDNNFRNLDVIVQLTVDDLLDTPPGSPADDSRYLVIATATGAWAGHEDDIAVWTKTEDPDTRDWVFITPKIGWVIWGGSSQDDLEYYGSGPGWAVRDWVQVPGGTASEGDILRYDGSTGFVPVRPMRGISFGSEYNATAVHTTDQVVFSHRFAFPFTIPADFGDYQGSSTTVGAAANADADVIIRVQRAVAASPLTLADVGTLTVGAGTIDLSDKDSSAADITFEKDDVIIVIMPTSPDADFAGVFGTIIGYETAP